MGSVCAVHRQPLEADVCAGICKVNLNIVLNSAVLVCPGGRDIYMPSDFGLESGGFPSFSTPLLIHGANPDYQGSERRARSSF